MQPIDAATASGDAINGLGTHFMMDMATYAYGATLGFDGVDFYLSGRGGALGEVPADVVETERNIAEQKTREEGKPEQAIAKIVEGRLGGFYKEIVLLEQESVTESKKSVKAVLDEAGTTVKRFARFEVGA